MVCVLPAGRNWTVVRNCICSLNAMETVILLFRCVGGSYMFELAC
jgi:hypothetical protein